MATPTVRTCLLRALNGQPRGLVWSQSPPNASWTSPFARLASSRATSTSARSPEVGRGRRSAPCLEGDYREQRERALREPGPFWGALARGALLWDTPHHTDCEWDFSRGHVRWFLGGRLNVAGKKCPFPWPRGEKRRRPAEPPPPTPILVSSLPIFSLQASCCALLSRVTPS